MISVLLVSMSITNLPSANAHQPVVLLPTDTSPAKGPLLADGTISFAVRASFTKAGEKRAFRAAFKSGDLLTVQYLIVDQKPENALRTTKLPLISIISPKRKVTNLKINERTKFFEPFGKTNYLFLSRFSATAESGIYEVLLTSRGKASVTIAIGDREISGEVIRGTTSSQTSSNSASPTISTPASPTEMPSASPTPSPTTSISAATSKYTMEQVKANNGATSCWSVIEGDVYDLTKWISSHPGGAAAIRSLCGIDGTSAFNAQHEGQKNPAARLSMYRLGPLTK